MAERPPRKKPRDEPSLDSAPRARRPVRPRRGGDATAPGELSSATKQKVKVVVAVLLGLFVMVFITRVIGNLKPRMSGDVAGTSDAAGLFAEAKALIRQGKWAAAKAKLEAVREEDDDYEPRQIENYLKVAEEELPNEERFTAITDALEKNELSRAKSVLGQVKTTTQDKALSAAKDALAQRIEARRAEARTLLSSQQWEPLLALSTDLLGAMPGDRDASEWKQQAEQAIARGKKGPTKVISADTPWLEAQQRFKSGDVSGARSLAKACSKKYAKCRDFQSGLDVFEAKTARLEALSDGDLLLMFKLDRELAGGTSSQTSQQLRARVAERYFLKASSAKTSGSWVKALEYAAVALDADPQHAGSKTLVAEGRSKSSDLYLRGYQLRETDPAEAVRLFKEVLTMTLPTDENHIKARGFIERLEAR